MAVNCGTAADDVDDCVHAQGGRPVGDSGAYVDALYLENTRIIHCVDFHQVLDTNTTLKQLKFV